MAKRRNYRWYCPYCNKGRLAPKTLSREDPRAYCFACSKSKGYMIRLECPALEKEKNRRAEIRRRRADARKERIRVKQLNLARAQEIARNLPENFSAPEFKRAVKRGPKRRVSLSDT